jgi:molecular chaperone DnaK (HSP70)
MKKNVLMCALLVVTAFGTAAQETAKPKADDRTPAVTPLRVQLVFAEYDGEKKVSILPYTFTVNADERRARPGSLIRNGARVPVATGKDQSTYVDIGTNMDCSATLQEDGRYKLQMTLERSSISPETPAGSGNPIIRQFRVDLNPVLKDGQTVESVVSTDPLNGHVYHVSVTLNVVK